MMTAQIEDSTTSDGQAPVERQVHSCNFRYAGRLSNENARVLTMLGEKFAASVAHSLEAYLGTALEMKLLPFDQASIHDYLSTVQVDSYLVPCALGIMESSFLMQLDAALVLPIIDLLLGGTGTELSDSRELSDIDEEILQGVSSVVIREVERSWHWLHLTFTLGHNLKPATIAPLFSAKEKVVVLVFETKLGAAVGHLRLVLPTSFVGYLLRHQTSGISKKPVSLTPGPSLRQRVLDCEFTVSADITQMRVLIRDLVSLAPGKVLTMRAPVKSPGRLTIEGVEVFEAAPVRSGSQKAAQLLLRSSQQPLTKEV